PAAGRRARRVRQRHLRHEGRHGHQPLRAGHAASVGGHRRGVPPVADAARRSAASHQPGAGRHRHARCATGRADTPGSRQGPGRHQADRRERRQPGEDRGQRRVPRQRAARRAAAAERQDQRSVRRRVRAAGSGTGRVVRQQAGGRAGSAAPPRPVRRVAALRIGRHQRRHGRVLRDLSGGPQPAAPRSAVRQRQGHRRRVRAGLCRHDRSGLLPGDTARSSRQGAARAATATEHRAQAVSERAGARRTGLVAGAMPTRRSTAGPALEAEQSRNFPQAPSRRLRSAIRRPRHRLGPGLTDTPRVPTGRDCPMTHSSWRPRSSGPMPKGFRQRAKGWEGAKEGRQGERPYPEKAKRRPRAARHPGFAMLSLFQRKRVPPTAGTPPTSAIETPKGSMRPESAASLLATPRRQKLLEHIWQRTSLSRRQFATPYLAPLERYAELVQQFPASENHHHAYPGGMLDHGLEIVAYALKLRQSYLLPAGVTPEAQAAQAEAWTAGTAYAALLHDIGKIAVDLHVEHADGSVWHPWHGPLRKPYRFRYRKEREYRLHSAATGLLYARLLDRDIFDWLSGYPDLWAALLYVLAGQYEHAGTLGELVVQADQASVAQEL